MVSRIGEFIGYLSVSVRSFEIAIGASNGLIRKAIVNNTDIQGKWVQRIVDNYPQLSAEWLLTGKGEMLKTPLCMDAQTSNNQVHHGTGDNNIISSQEHEIEFLKKIIDEKERRIEEKERIIEEKERLIQVLQALTTKD